MRTPAASSRSGRRNAVSRLLAACLLLAVAGAARPAAAQTGPWVVSERRGHVEFYSEWHCDRAALLRELDAVASELNTLLGIPAPRQPVQIILFASRGNYLRYLSDRLPESRSRVALFYQNGETSQIYVTRSTSLITDLRHEYTHVLLHQHLAFLPLWIDEGLAEYLELPEAERLRAPRAKAVMWKARFGWSPPLSELEMLREPLEMTHQDYAASWAVICFLLNSSPANRQILQDYLDVIARGEAPGRFSRFSSRIAPGVTEEMSSWLRRPEIRLNLIRAD